MPACKTESWWTEDDVARPQRCMDAYARLRAAGKNEISAVTEAYRTDGSCRGPE